MTLEEKVRSAFPDATIRVIIKGREKTVKANVPLINSTQLSVFKQISAGNSVSYEIKRSGTGLVMIFTEA